MEFNNLKHLRKNEKGITLVALIITIVILLILAVVAISSIQNDGIMQKAEYAAFKSKVTKYEEELTLYINEKEMDTLFGFDATTLVADKTTNPAITDIIKSMNEEDASNFSIQAGKLVYLGSDSQEQEWSGDLGLQVGYTLKRIYGNSIQDTTNGDPSPSNPVEIQSVGDKTKNLFDMGYNFTSKTSKGITITYSIEEGCFIINGTSTATDIFGLRYINLPITINDAFSISAKYVSGTITKPSGGYAVGYFGKGNEINSFSNWENISLNTNDTKWENQTCDCDYITAFWFYITNGVSFDNYKVKIQLEEGSTATEYEPYGYKIPIEVNGKNLLKLPVSTTTNREVTCDVSNNNVVSFDGTSTGYPVFQYDVLNIPANTSVTISYNATNEEKVIFRLRNSVSGEYVDIGNGKTKAPTFDVDGIQIALYPNFDYSDFEINNIQLELGTTATDYEPYSGFKTNIYLDEPLRKVGEYKDYIDFENKTVVRKIAKIDLGTLSWLTQDTAQGRFWASVGENIVFPANQSTISDFLCTRYNVIAYSSYTSSDDVIYSAGTTKLIYVKDTTYSDAATFKSSIDGTYLLYPLVTPEPPQTIDLPDLPILTAETTLSIDTQVQPSSIEK